MYALNTKIMGVILAVELAHEKGWTHLWLECDSQVANLYNRWQNYLDLLWNMTFRVTHICKEGNFYACCIANIEIYVSIVSFGGIICLILLRMVFIILDQFTFVYILLILLMLVFAIVNSTLFFPSSKFYSTRIP